MVPGVRGTWDWRRLDTGWQRFLISCICFSFNRIWIDLSVVTLAVSLFSSCQDVWLACRHDHSSRKLAVASWSWVLLQQSSFGGRGAGQQFVWSFTYPYHTHPGPGGLDFAWSLHDFSVWQYSSPIILNRSYIYIYICSDIPSHLVSSHFISSHLIISRPIVSHHVSPHLISSRLISSRIILCRVISCNHFSSCLIMFHYASSCLIMSHHVSS